MGRLCCPGAGAELPRVLGNGRLDAGGRGSGKLKLRPLELEKARAQLEALAEDRLSGGGPQAHDAAFLVFPGLFDPVHVAHVSILERAREVVAAQGAPVVAGFLAPLRADAPGSAAAAGQRSSGEERDGPPGAAAGPLDRNSVCAAACEGSDWLSVCTWGWDSSPRITDRMGRQLAEQLAWAGGVRWDFLDWWVAGSSEDLQRLLHRGCRPVVCVAPPGGAEPFLSRALALAARAVPRRPGRASAPALVQTARKRAFGLGSDRRPLGLLARGRQQEVPADALHSLVAQRSWGALSERGWLPEAVLHHLRRAAEEELGEATGMEEEEEAAEDTTATESSKAPSRAAAASPSEGPGCKKSSRSKAQVHFTTGDAAKASQSSGRKIVAHICNDQGNGGRGFFQAIKREWGPAASRAYFEWHRDRGREGGFHLGAVQFVRVGPLVEVANMIGKQGSKEGSKGPPVRHGAVEEALRTVAQHAAETGASVHMPMGSGGGAGLPREQLAPLLKAVSEETGAAFYVYAA